jgi:hypothetical protein
MARTLFLWFIARNQQGTVATIKFGSYSTQSIAQLIEQKSIIQAAGKIP